MGIILYSSPNIPPEWIAAHGLMPSRLIPKRRPRQHHSGMGEGVCPFMWQFVCEAVADDSADGIVLATNCDQMRRASDLIRKECSRPNHLFHVPATWRTGTSCKLFESELQRLSHFLVNLGGRAPSCKKLAGVMQEYDRTRQALLVLRTRIAPRIWAETLFTFYRTGQLEVLLHPTPASRGAIRVGLIGGPLFQEDLDLMEMVETYGGSVVLDGTETGERTFPAAFRESGLTKDPLRELARAYCDSIPEAFRRPNTLLYEWVAGEIRRRKVKGLIICRHLWCDIWHAEVHRLRNRLGIPVLDLDLDNACPAGRTTTRLQAFMESLQR